MSASEQNRIRWENEMQGVSSQVVRAILQGVRGGGVTKEAACIAAIIGALSIVKLDGLNEEKILKEAQKACPDPQVVRRTLLGGS